ncbi:MAG: DUF484 family protein [Gammaproteobacteria bacterium]|nr:DUF484 family protein [Gammaproteobacteria bacterium]
MTNITNAEPVPDLNLDETSVIDYLKNNPETLERHPEVLTMLTFPHESGAAVSLVERQLKLLREENKELKDKLSGLVKIARENEELGQRFHRLSLELMATQQLHDIVALTQDQVQTFFYTDYVSFCFHDELAEKLDGLEKNTLDAQSPLAPKVRSWMHSRKPVFGPLEDDMLRLLFGDNQQIASSVLIPIYHTRDIGLLMLGSKSQDRFRADMGTVFLKQLGELISHKLKYFLS